VRRVRDPGTRCDLVEAVASSLTECFASDLMSDRIAAWERHYPWVQRDALAYFRLRVPRARTDGEQALAFVCCVTRAPTSCRSVVCKRSSGRPRFSGASSMQSSTPGRRHEPRRQPPRLAPRARLRFDRHAGQWLLLYPERGLALNASAAAIVTSSPVTMPSRRS
jgi:hypothetical protein